VTPPKPGPTALAEAAGRPRDDGIHVDEHGRIADPTLVAAGIRTARFRARLLLFNQ
jgi:hypothetical protein